MRRPVRTAVRRRTPRATVLPSPTRTRAAARTRQRHRHLLLDACVVGLVLGMYAQGALKADGEVAVGRLPRGGHRRMTVPLVDVRWTVSKAVAQGALGEEPVRHPLGAARSPHWTERSRGTITYMAGRRSASAGEAAGALGRFAERHSGSGSTLCFPAVVHRRSPGPLPALRPDPHRRTALASGARGLVHAALRAAAERRHHRAAGAADRLEAGTG
ncbi:TfuA-like protein [Streptomyces ziwulingensis]